MSRSTIPADWHNCATCTHWCGYTKPDPFCKFIEYDTSDRGRCAGGGFNMMDMPPMATCSKWERRFR